jgi:transposase-like protein
MRGGKDCTLISNEATNGADIKKGAEATEKKEIIYYCPNCSSELEKISSCGSVGYFCNKCNELISRKRILSKKQLKNAL